MNNSNTFIDKNTITEFIFLILLFTPFLSYITFGIYGKENFIYYFQIFIIFYSTFLLFYNKLFNIYIPKYLYFLFFYILYILFWSFFNGTFEKKGFFFSEIREQIAVFFILLLINNIKISDKFIKTSIQIIKATIIIAFLVSIYQFFNPSFFDASELYRFKYFEKPNIDISNPYEGRRTSIFGYTDLNDIGLSFLPILSVFLGYYSHNKNKAYLYFALGMVIAALSNTRYIIIGVVFLIFPLWKGSNFRIKHYLLNILTLSIVFIFTIILIQLIGYDLLDWFNVRLFAEGSIIKTTRFGALENFLIFYPQTPIVGTGVHMTPEIALASKFVGSSQIHVGYLSHLVSYGIIGSFLLFGFWISLTKELFKNAKISKYWGSFFAFIIFLWANLSLVMYSIFFYGLIFAIIFDRYFKEKSFIRITSHHQHQIN